MARYLLIALNSPTNGGDVEAKYNEWYNKTHVGELLSVDGSRSVRRFKVLHQNRVDQDYVSVTEIDADDPDTVMQQLAERASDITDTMDRASSAFVFAVELDTSE